MKEDQQQCSRTKSAPVPESPEHALEPISDIDSDKG
jgi:hypothetical protein